MLNGLTLTVLLAAVVVTAAVSTLLSAYIIKSMRGQYEIRIAEKIQELARAYRRIEHLELTIDEVRSQVLSTSLPPAAAAHSARSPLPEAIANELAAFEDPDVRAELEADARMQLEADPDADPAAIAREMTGG